MLKALLRNYFQRLKCLNFGEGAPEKKTSPTIKVSQIHLLLAQHAAK